MITGTTGSGFTFTISEEQMDDYELLEGLVELDKGNESAIVDVIDRLLGTDQKNQLKNHVRNENGKVTATGMVKEVVDIMSVCNQGKNS